jgi:dihydrofolate reductase
MRKLTVNTFMTLDGVMQAPGGPEEDRSGGFKHGGWLVNYWDDTMGRFLDETISNPYDLLLGRKTYEIFAAHWPYRKDEPMADSLNSVKKYVASRTLKSVDWNNSTLIPGDVAEFVAKLKEQSGPGITVWGSANLLQTLIKHDLIDEYRLMIFPLVLGEGKRLFGDGTIPGGLKLTDSRTASTGVMIATYERAGEVKYGSVSPEEPTEAEVERRKRAEVGG